MQPELIFTSDLINEELKMGGKSYLVKFTTKTAEDSRGNFIEGEFQTTFTNFDIPPPSVAGGLVAKGSDELTLMFHMYLDEIIRK